MHPEDHEVPEDFSTYYYESLARSGEDIPEDDEAEIEEPRHYSIEGSGEEDKDGHEPIPIRADRPDVFPSDPDPDVVFPDAAHGTTGITALDATSETETTDHPSGS
jgi:hypothetical protein